MAEAFLQHVNVNVDDFPRAVAFYRDVLGLELDATPDQGFRSQFFRLAGAQQIHLNELADDHAFRGHFCLVAPDFVGVFRRAQAAGAIDLRPWGKIRRLPSGAMQMFVRDPAGNLIEIASARDAEIPAEIMRDPAFEPRPGVYRIPPGAAEGRHENV
jgi:catechol 2,3-dioxygenase-like lactoylglutathione lyase family enzyme